MHELLKKIEEQAVQIARLQARNEQLSDMLNDLPGIVRKQLLEGMAQGPVNCGPYCGCSLARRLLEQG